MSNPESRHAREVSDFLDEVPPPQRALVNAMRRLVAEAAPDAEETVVWGGLSYHLPALGGRVRGAVCQLTPKPDGVHVGFVHGVHLPDPARILEGDGKSKRHVRVASAEEIPRAALCDLVRAAVAIRPPGTFREYEA